MRFKKKGKVNKGTPTAIVISILIHAGLFLLAGMFVVFTVVRQKEVEFEPPKPVERPKMKLKKPKVKIKKSSKPKPTTRIVTKVQKTSMPDIQLPEMSGAGNGIGGGLGGFDLMPDLSDPTMYGAGQSIGNDFEGTFYDFKRGRDGRVLSNVDTSGDEWRQKVHKFLREGWKPSVFSRYYRAPKKLYATSFVVPVTRSALAPLAFGDEKAVGALWVVHYKGQLVNKEGITFRFRGAADEFIAVRVDGKLVLCAAWDLENRHFDERRSMLFGSLWSSHSADSWKYWMGNTLVEVGDWITLEPGVPVDMEILIGDNGGLASFFLAVEEKGVEYQRNRQGGPVLPAFKTDVLSHNLLDAIYKNLYPGEISLTNGPVFCDYDISAPLEPEKQEPTVSQASACPKNNKKAEVRTWTFTDGRTVEAEFVNIFGGKIVLKTASGKTRKIPKKMFSEEDVKYAELEIPPSFDINVLKSFHHTRFSGGFYDIKDWDRPPEEQGHYGVQLKQTSTGDYGYDLDVEMFVLGKQWRRSKYILLDRQKTTFVPAAQENRMFEFRSDRKVVLATDEIKGESFGEEYYGYLVVVTDLRGEIIAMKSSHKWLPEKLGNLRKLSVGNFMDENCVRTYPDPPPRTVYY